LFLLQLMNHQKVKVRIHNSFKILNQIGMFIVHVALSRDSLKMNYGIIGLKIMEMNIYIPFVQFVLQIKKRIVLNKKEQRVGDSLPTSLRDMDLKKDILNQENRVKHIHFLWWSVVIQMESI
jgi:hypothetical protein